MSVSIAVTKNERLLHPDNIIVSKTDARGIITYANREFMDVAGYQEGELLGKPHSIVRHPDMPRCVFKFFWERIEAGHEIFAYVKNRAKNGDFYWVLAHATPNYDKNGGIQGFHSSRRAPNRGALDQVIIPTYRALLEVEQSAIDRKEGMSKAYQVLVDTIGKTGMDYDQWIYTLFAL